ncbi:MULTISPECIES: type II toxin-antitoxin system prevent-host-death family antitoxin [unclassified Pseudovibrio]|uniref:type II toxin-antitoxin system Phd/YefM family antitoxin n=1 Tax=unclassified Pseudovibrio TaxID=2627060 RepID=UPI0007AE75B2|nr:MULTISPECIES: type II toxin-antitoxin system prevent-host-death family antitoxin [unclassified Pseudovibrio]KZK92442.1 Phd YefM [Pseudovibrio sp. W74]KZL06200.1 Phd YefM [Pseudovibrio sp. Ad14]
MPVTKLSSREFNQDIGKAKRASSKGPVIITDRGKPSQVLLSFEEYKRLTNKRRSIAKAVAMPSAAEVEFDPQKSNITNKPVDLT